MGDDAPCPYVRGTPEGTRWCALAADDRLREAARLAVAEWEWGMSRSDMDRAIAALREALGD